MGYGFIFFLRPYPFIAQDFWHFNEKNITKNQDYPQTSSMIIA